MGGIISTHFNNFNFQATNTVHYCPWYYGKECEIYWKNLRDTILKYKPVVGMMV